MRSIWLLPDREQTGCVPAIENETISVIHELINVRELPPEFILGIPEEVFRSKQESFFLFAQYAKLKSGSNIFCLSAPSGKDVSKRAVVTSNFQILKAGEVPNLKLDVPLGISAQEQRWIKDIISINETSNLELLKPINIMLKAIKENKHLSTFSSEKLTLARNKPEWMPQKKSPLRCSKQSYKTHFFIIISFIIAAATLFFNE